MPQKYVIHFDLNRTILMSDAAGGRSMENTVNYLLSEVTWGRCEDATDDSKKWVCVSTKPSVYPPSEGLMTYKAFVDSELPYLKLGVDSPPEGFTDVKTYNKQAKKKRTALQSAFTSEGAPGETLQEECQAVIRSLHIPGGMADQAIAISGNLEDGALKETWASGRYFLLPSFLKLLETIQARSDSLDVAIVFRTFGVDILEVAKELEVLTNGQHPCKPGFTLNQRYKLQEPYNTFYRDGYGSEGLLLAENTVTKVPAEFSNQEGGGERFYGDEANVTVHKGFAAAAAVIRSQLETRSVIGCRDYWEWWSAHAEEAAYGKVLLVDPSDTDVLHMFFDDHVESHHAHIVDARDVNTGEVMPFEQALGRHLFRAEPYLAITDEDYFVNALDAMLASNATTSS